MLNWIKHEWNSVLSETWSEMTSGGTTLSWDSGSNVQPSQTMAINSKELCMLKIAEDRERWCGVIADSSITTPQWPITGVTIWDDETNWHLQGVIVNITSAAFISQKFFLVPNLDLVNLRAEVIHLSIFFNSTKSIPWPPGHASSAGNHSITQPSH